MVRVGARRVERARPGRRRCPACAGQGRRQLRARSLVGHRRLHRDDQPGANQDRGQPTDERLLAAAAPQLPAADEHGPDADDDPAEQQQRHRQQREWQDERLTVSLRSDQRVQAAARQGADDQEPEQNCQA